MKVPANDSYLWPLLLIVLLCIVYAVIATLGTRNGFDVQADSKAIVGLIVTVASFAMGKRAAVGPTSPPPDSPS
jgi:hypothetical protein